MAYLFSWAVTALLGVVGALLVFGPAGARISFPTRFLGGLSALLGLAGLVPGAPAPGALPLSAWGAALLVSALAFELLRPGGAKSDPTVDPDEHPPWMAPLEDSRDAFVVLDEHDLPRAQNAVFAERFPDAEWERVREILVPLLKSAERSGHARGMFDLRDPRAAEPADGLPASADTKTEAAVVHLNGPSEPRRRLVMIRDHRAKSLALLTRRSSHDFNNLLSAIVGGAGMAMDLVEEGSEIHRELTEIENVAMRAADITAELQRAAREIAPPEAEPLARG